MSVLLLGYSRLAAATSRLVRQMFRQETRRGGRRAPRTFLVVGGYGKLVFYGVVRRLYFGSLGRWRHRTDRDLERETEQLLVFVTSRGLI